MPTLEVAVQDGQLLVSVSVGLAHLQDETHHFRALIDTGAQRTLVSAQVIETLGAVSLGIEEVVGISGEPQPTDVFELGVAIVLARSGRPVEQADDDDMLHSAGRVLPVLELPFAPQEFEVLLGMDLLSKYHITLHADRMIISN